MRNKISENLINKILKTIPKYTLEELEDLYPERNLGESAIISRFAPSPTGFMHIGNLYQAFINYKLAKQSNGIFILRIEDTDSKREVEGAVDLINSTLEKFNLIPDESGYKLNGKYGPYKQSERKDIYLSMVAELMRRGLAYPCFLSAKDMEEIREKQTSLGIPTGIYGTWAKYRDLDEDSILEKLNEGITPSIRLYSMGDTNKKIVYKDLSRGILHLPENNEDIVLIKSNDNLPTYHFAHLVDDHFMRTTNVIRGEEWLPSLPLHLQLFKMMGWKIPTYTHTSTLDKIDDITGKQRKLSKRHDFEASVKNFIQEGWESEVLLEYLLNILSSGYEEEKRKNKDINLWNYNINLKKIPISGVLFDIKKLQWWAKEYIANLSIGELFSKIINWVDVYDTKFKKIFEDKEQLNYLRKILSIERENQDRIRKDFINWRQTIEEIKYFWNEYLDKTLIESFEFNRDVLNLFLKSFNIEDSKDIWWKKICDIADTLSLKKGDVAMHLRVSICGRKNTPDLYSIIQVMGYNMVVDRIKNIL